jgi:hypothetical protein
VDRIDLSGYHHPDAPAGITELRFEDLDGGNLLLRFVATDTASRPVPVAQEVELHLAVPDPEVFRFFHVQKGTHFYTASAAERDVVVAHFSDVYSFEGTAFLNAGEVVSGTGPVYRFFHSQQGTHFYTASAAERDFVQAH